MFKNSKKEVTSKEVASKAAVVLQDPEASADEKSVAASALTQAADVKAHKESKPKERKERPVGPISHNPALLEWPTDVWGLTKDLKKALLALSSRINGQPDKKELVEKTLKVALGHLDSRYSHDNALRRARQAKAEKEAATAEEDNKPELF